MKQQIHVSRKLINYALYFLKFLGLLWAPIWIIFLCSVEGKMKDTITFFPFAFGCIAMLASIIYYGYFGIMGFSWIMDNYEFRVDEDDHDF